MPKARSRQWQLQEAKAKFSELFERALTEGPQVVTRHGKDSVVILPEADYLRLKVRRMPLSDVFASAPKVDLDLGGRNTPPRPAPAFD